MIFRQPSFYDSLSRRGTNASYIQVQEIQLDIAQLVQDIAKVPLDIQELNAFANAQLLGETHLIIKHAGGPSELTELGKMMVEKYKKKI